MNHSFPSKFRRLVALTLALVLAIGLTGCFQKDEPTDEIIKGTVSADDLNVRSNHSTDSTVLSQLPVGLEIEILEQKTVDDTNWGLIGEMALPDGTKIDGGWINLQYVEFADDSESDPTEPTIETQTEPTVDTWTEVPTVPATMGTITAGELKIRKGAGSKYESIDTYLKGDRVEILETTTVDDTVWGRTSIGWIGMGYVKMDGTASSNSSIVVTDSKTAILGYGVVDLGSLNVRSGPGTGYDKVSTVSEGIRYAYYQTIEDWVRIEDGWISAEYFYIEGTTADDAATGTITTEELNIRTGPDTSFKSTGAYKQGESIEILAQVDGWGYTSKGWVSMNHVKLAEPTYTTGTGTVATGLNIRKEANADSEKVGTYQEGDKVTITEVENGWGKTDKGWINLKYVVFD